jgi:hypothetical protein
MPARVTAKVRITVRAQHVLRLLEAAVVFLRVCCTNSLTLMYICPDNKRCHAGTNLLYRWRPGAALKCPVEAIQLPRRCCADSQTFVSTLSLIRRYKMLMHRYSDNADQLSRGCCASSPAMLLKCQTLLSKCLE